MGFEPGSTFGYWNKLSDAERSRSSPLSQSTRVLRYSTLAFRLLSGHSARVLEQSEYSGCQSTLSKKQYKRPSGPPRFFSHLPTLDGAPPLPACRSCRPTTPPVRAKRRNWRRGRKKLKTSPSPPTTVDAAATKDDYGGVVVISKRKKEIEDVALSANHRGRRHHQGRLRRRRGHLQEEERNWTNFD